MANLKVNILGLEFENPLLTAAGPGAKDGDMCLAAVKGGVGGLVTKTVSVGPADVPRPCMAKIKGGFVNTELWSELPIEQWLETEYKKCREAGVPVIISMGYTAEEIAKIAPMVKPYADAVELSIHYVGTDVAPIVETVKVVKEALDVPVFMKMSPSNNIQEIALACEKAGADGLTMINSFGPVLSIDTKTGYPIMGSKEGYGWLSGDAVKPLAIRCIYDAARVVDIPIIGVGGVSTGEDMAEMMMAGASAVQICTEAILEGPTVYGKIVKQLNDFLDKNNWKDVNDIVGLTIKKANERNFRTHTIVPEVDHDTCVRCSRCVRSCMYDAITVGENWEVDPDKCFGCGVCVTVCPTKALSIQLD